MWKPTITDRISSGARVARPRGWLLLRFTWSSSPRLVTGFRSGIQRQCTGGDATLADVGYLREDGFARLFNVTLPPDHPSQQLGVPPDFEEPLSIPDHLKSRREDFFDPGQVLGSRDVWRFEFGAGASAYVHEALTFLFTRLIPK